MAPERWQPLPHPFRSGYEVSDRGRVRSHLYRAPRFLRYFDDRGYSRVSLQLASGDEKKFFVHALVLHAFVGPRPEGLVIRHLDGNPQNNNLSNLRYGTQAENEGDKRSHRGLGDFWHCMRGHEWTDANTYREPGGKRRCRECKRLADRRRKRHRLPAVPVLPHPGARRVQDLLPRREPRRGEATG